MSKKILDDTGVSDLVNSIATNIANKYATKDEIITANGGNADTLDGLHANQFVENNLVHNIKFSISCGDHDFITKNFDSNVPNLPVLSNYMHIVGRDSEGSVIDALSIGYDYTKNVYSFNKLDNTWRNIADGGNASSIQSVIVPDGTSANTCVGEPGKIIMYYCSTNGEESAGFIDLPPQSLLDYAGGISTKQGIIIAINFNGAGIAGQNVMWCKQIFISPHFGRTFTRYIDGTTISEWKYEDTVQSNPNLLINPDFKINQRGIISGTFSADTYTCDRWRLQTSGTVEFSVSTNSLSCSVDDSHYLNIIQTLDLNEFPYLYGKTVTFSANIKSYSGTVSVRISQGSSYANIIYDTRNIITKTGVNQVSCVVQNDSTSHYLNITICMDYYTASSFEVGWTKLEVGPVATPFVPPDPATELLKCMRYYEVILGGTDRSYHAILVPGLYTEADIQFMVPKRVAPTTIINGIRTVVTTSTNYLISFTKYKIYQTEIYGMTLVSVDPVITELPSDVFGVTLDGSFAVDAEIY